MSGSVSQCKVQDPGLPVTDLLAYSEAQLIEYFDTHADGNGGFDISGLVGVQELSHDQRMELAGKVHAALSQIESRALSRPLEIDELHARLTGLADANARTNESDGTPVSDRQRSPASSSSWSTQLPTGDEKQRLQEASYHVLIEDGGRPACSLEHWSHLVTTPTPNYEAVSPWLPSRPGAEEKDVKACVEHIFTRQLTRWSRFRRSQWDNRGIGDSEEAAEAYLERCRRKYQAAYGQPGRYGRPPRTVVNSYWEKHLRGAWKRMSIDKHLRKTDEKYRPRDPQLRLERRLPKKGFHAHSVAVKRNIAPYNFSSPIQLKENPHQQTEWSDWLEYLSYEVYWLEVKTAFVEPLQKQHDQGVEKLVKLVGDRGRTMIYSTEDLKAAQEALSEMDDMLHDFYVATFPFLEVQGDVKHQRAVVEWIVKEARLMDAEMCRQDTEQDTRQEKAAENYLNGNRNRKRKHSDDCEEMLAENPLKRAKQNTETAIAVDILPSKPQPRRSSRLAAKKAIISV